jgi:hypothetical protein
MCIGDCVFALAIVDFRCNVGLTIVLIGCCVEYSKDRMLCVVLCVLVYLSSLWGIVAKSLESKVYWVSCQSWNLQGRVFDKSLDGVRFRVNRNVMHTGVRVWKMGYLGKAGM